MILYGEVVVIDGEANLLSIIDGDLSLLSMIDGEGEKVIPYSPYERYTGEYTITPSAETQILETADMLMTNNITINPIPTNYGLITWNGYTLTVS